MMYILLRTLFAITILFNLLLGYESHGQELFSTVFNEEENWDNPGDGSWTGYNEKTYEEGDWFFHSTSAVRGTPDPFDETYGGSSFSFRDRDVFTVYNTAPVSGMSGFSMQLRDWMTGGGKQRNLKISLNGGGSWETVEVINKDWFDDYQVYQEFVYNFPGGQQSFTAEQFMIELDGGDDTNAGRINIGQFVALGGANVAAAPTFNPNGGTFFSPVSVEIETATPDATIFFSTFSQNGPWSLYQEQITVSGTTTLWAYATATGFNNSNVTQATFTFPEATEVTTLAALRSMPVDDTHYIYTGDAVIVAMDDFRNRKFIQDETAAILIDDAPGVITTEYQLYDVISGIIGQLDLFHNMLRFQPLENTEAAAENTPVEPYPYNINQVTPNDQAKLVNLQNITFVNIDDDQVFASGTNYTITDGNNELIFRTEFWNADYIGTLVPVEPVDITGVIMQYQDNLQITARFQEDIILSEPPDDTANITLSTETIPSFRNVYTGNHSDVQFYSVEASGLDGDLTITAGNPLKISLNCTYDFQASIVLEAADGNVPEQNVYVRAFPLSIGNYNPVINHSDGTVSELITTNVAATVSQVPSGYYSTATGSGEVLMTQLHNIINNHTVLSYASIWEHFVTTDSKFNGKVWDIFSYIECEESPYEYTFFDDQQGADPVPDAEGFVYNREHLWPQSWWSGSNPSPMVSDMHHVYPADRWVNMQKSNYPFGEINNPDWTSEAGNMIGNNSYGSDYQGMVFEPVDELKGDFARTYFYMATRYMDQLPDWSNNSVASAVLDGTEFPGFEQWFLDLLLEWHENDPVSQKEIERNNAIYGLQNNRNPFIDNPGFVELVWGDVSDIPEVDLCNLDFEDWFDGLPDCWYGDKSNIGTSNVIQYADDPYTGNYAAQLINTSGSHQRFTSQPTTVENGVAYVITFWVKGYGQIRTGLFDDRETGFGYAPYNDYIDVESASWAEYSQILTAANTSDIAEFIFSLRNTNEAFGHLKLDHVSVQVYEPEPPTEVDKLADLRNMPADGTVYHYTGNAVIVAMDGFRNRKFIQDETAAILIDDLPGVISTEYDLYDVMTNITGIINISNNMVRFQPWENTAPATENTPLSPYLFYLEEVTPDDQAKLIQFEHVVFVDFDEGDVFESGTSYTISDGVHEFALRTDFWNVDYIGTEIPATPVNISGVVLQFQETLQIVPRFQDDFELLDELFYTVTFVVQDTDGQDVENAVVTLGDIENAAGDYVFENVEAGDYFFSVSALCFETFNGDLNVLEDIEVEVVLDYDILPGDANGDGLINILDVITIANYFTDNPHEPFCFHNADTNQDGEVNILDVIATVMIIAGQ